MSLFGNLFHKAPATSALLINIGANSVGGAYVQESGGPPVLLYAKRVPIEARAGEAPETSISRALPLLVASLLNEGAPALQRATGSGAAEGILVCLDAPWQTTSMRVERIEEARPFVFTERLVNEKLASASQVPLGQVLVDESLVGTVLNGYETSEPYGKHAQQAIIVILVSSVATKIAEAIALALRQAYHTRQISLIAGASLRYQAMRAAFPLERNFLILDATGPEIAIALVRHGLLVAIREAPDGGAGDAKWSAEVRGALAALAASYPLPQVIFLLAQEGEMERLSAVLDAANLGTLWLSDNPPKVVALTAQHLAGMVSVKNDLPPDLLLSLMALYLKSLSPMPVASRPV
ncbi:hypothetical protein HY091_01275 [Candidatus Kaiserbacteria bacterium]|nr:hypothetical protein [Candidatus Kaiserbacteria bacterium]